jgi:ribonuclease VapC
MIVDTSAVVAIAMDEPDARRLLTLLRGHPAPRISAANLLEAYIVIDRRRGHLAQGTIVEGVLPVGITVEPVTEAQVEIARDAYRQYGKGSGHPARLNYGDCFAYALARERDEPLLFIGDDFALTDITQAVPDQ